MANRLEDRTVGCLKCREGEVMGLIVSEHSKPRQRWLSFLRPLSRTKNTLGRRTLLLTVVLSVAFALLVPGVAGIMIDLQNAKQQAYTDLEKDLDRATGVLAASLSAPVWDLSKANGESIVRAMADDDRFVSVVVTDANTGDVFVEFKNSASGTAAISSHKAIEREGREIGSVEVAMTLAPYLEAARIRWQNNLLRLSVVLLVALSAIILILRNRLVLPVRLLADEARRIADGRLTIPIKSVGANEFGQVADAMEHMRARLLETFEQLEERNRRSLSIIEASPVPLIMVADCGEVTFLNRAFVSVFGYSMDDIPTIDDWWRNVSTDSKSHEVFVARWQTNLDEAKRSGDPFSPLEFNVQCKNGLTRAVIGSAAAVERDFSGSQLIVLYDISERKQAEERINTLAFSDQLTGLANRTLLTDRLRLAIARSDRGKSYDALLYIDLDHFKVLNDTLGHDSGDLLLKQVSQRLVECVREGDTVARPGGDDFVVMLTDLGPILEEAAARVEIIGEKIRAALDWTASPGATDYRCTASIGITLFRGPRTESDYPLKQAELAMYKAKEGGRNAVRFFDPTMEASLLARSTLVANIRTALAEGQFLLYYQAQVLGDGRVTGAEALARWQHPQRGMVSPAEFIPAAEESGLIIPLGHWVMETACTQLALWAKRPELSALTLSVNVSANQFRQLGFVDDVLGILASTGANPHRLKLELTESLLVSDVADTIEKMFALKSKGVGFSLDDFGTGYSSLSYLKRMPLDQLKIDQSFVRDILVDPNDAAIANTIVALAHSLGLGVIAEGVETESQREFLARCGCHAYQGYLFSRPQSSEDFLRFFWAR